mgnify:CR=1 FL=1
MALFKISKGLKANLPSAKTAGNCWYTVDDSLFYIDYEDENGEVQRKALNAKDAETLSGASLAAILTDNELEVPTSKAVLDAIASYDSIPTTHVVHGESQELLSDIIETYILNIDYDSENPVPYLIDETLFYKEDLTEDFINGNWNGELNFKIYNFSID